MGSAVSTEALAKVAELEKAGKSNEAICEELKASGLVGGDLLTKTAEELAAEYAKSKRVELAPGSGRRPRTSSRRASRRA